MTDGVEDRNRWLIADPDEAPASGRHGAAVVVVDALGRVLLQQRDDHTPPAGYGRWAIPGGGVEEAETPRSAAYREILEETAIVLDDVEYFGSVLVAHHDENVNSGELTIHLFIARSDVEESAIVVGEGLAFRYWHPSEVEALPFNPNGRHWLDVVIRSESFRRYQP